MSAPRDSTLAPPGCLARAGRARTAPEAPGAPVGSRPDEELAVLAGRAGRAGGAGGAGGGGGEGGPEAALREAAFDELYRRYRSRVHRLVGWRLRGDPARSDDVTQEVFFQLYRSLPRYSGRARFRVWLWSLVRNVCRHRLRKLRRARALRPVESEWEPSEPREIADLAPGVVERLTRGELRERVRVEVARLPEVYRITLVLRDWDELSYVEIAEALSVPVGTVRSRLHKARALLADALREDVTQ